jgi:hypothetical protein
LSASRLFRLPQHVRHQIEEPRREVEPALRDGVCFRLPGYLYLSGRCTGSARDTSHFIPRPTPQQSELSTGKSTNFRQSQQRRNYASGSRNSALRSKWLTINDLETKRADTCGASAPVVHLPVRNNAASRMRESPFLRHPPTSTRGNGETILPTPGIWSPPLVSGTGDTVPESMSEILNSLTRRPPPRSPSLAR